MLDALEICSSLRQEVLHLQREAQLARDDLFVAKMQTETRHFPATLYGLVMYCFATVDLLSRYWRGSEGKQTGRMVAFLFEYFSVTREAAFIAVRMWRHTLMHTAQPRILACSDTGVEYAWLLHWGDWLPRSDHFKITRPTPQQKQLNLSLSYLIEDLHCALDKYCQQVATDPKLRANMLSAHSEVSRQSFSIPEWVDPGEFT